MAPPATHVTRAPIAPIANPEPPISVSTAPSIATPMLNLPPPISAFRTTPPGPLSIGSSYVNAHRLENAARTLAHNNPSNPHEYTLSMNASIARGRGGGRTGGGSRVRGGRTAANTGHDLKSPVLQSNFMVAILPVAASASFFYALFIHVC